MRFLTAVGVVALLGLPACMAGNGGSQSFASMSSGVGFGDYQRYLHERESARRTSTPYSVGPERGTNRAPVAQAPLAPPIQQAPIRQTALTQQPASVGAPLTAPMAPSAPFGTQSLPPPPQQVQNQPRPPQPTPGMQTASAPGFGTTPAFDAGPSIRAGLSDEQDFNAVASRETIESDRARLDQQRAQYQIVAVDSVPDSSVRSGPNVVEYALATAHPVGTQQYRRMNPLRWSRWENACRRFHNQDAAQEAFLAAGGPQRDPNHLDPDGDGYACWWDPTPYRQAMRATQ